MKIQDVKKECTAIVGLSIEFSNSEVDSIISLVRDLDISIQKGKADLAGMVDHSMQINSELAAAEKGVYGNMQFNADNATVTVGLKSLYRAFALLNKITRNRAFDPSDLFAAADIELNSIIGSINKGEQ